jgi:integrase
MPRSRDSARKTNVKAVNRRLADGSTKTYFYHVPTKLSLGADPMRAAARAAEIDALAGPELRVRQPGTIGDLVAKYKASPEFVGLAPRTQALWRPFLRDLEERVGDWVPKLFTRAMASKFKQTLIAKHGSGSARNRFKCFARVWNWSVLNGYTEVANPFAEPGSFSKGRRSPKAKPIWRKPDVDAFLSATRARNVGGNPNLVTTEVTRTEAMPDDVRLAFILGLLTTQRLGDVLRLSGEKLRADRDGRWWIKLRQGKTGTEVEFPVHKLLRDELERQGIEPGADRPLVMTQNGKFFEEKNFGRKFRTWLAAAGIRKLNFMALRRSGMIWLAEAGVSSPQIAALSGHSIATTQKILDEYIVKTRELAAAAVDAFERVTGDAFPAAPEHRLPRRA